MHASKHALDEMVRRQIEVNSTILILEAMD
jgi:hypothetical protein